MMLVFTENWEKVDRTGCAPGEFGRVIRGEYQVKSMFRHGWPSLYQFARERCMERVNGRLKWKPRWSRQGRVLIEDHGRQYGIHTFLSVKEETPA